MRRRLGWFLLGVIVGAVGFWQATQLLNKAKPSSVGQQVSRSLESVSTHATAFFRDFGQARREAEADLRRQAGLDL